MYPVTAGFVAAIAAPAHVAQAGCDAYLAGALVGPLAIAGGSVTADCRRSQTRDGALTCIVESEADCKTVYDRLVAPGLELAPWRGIVVDGDLERVPLGRFVVTSVDVARGESGFEVTANCADLSLRISRANWTEPLVIPAGTLLVEALATILEDRWPDVTLGFDAATTDDALGTKAVYGAGSGSDPWADAVALAQSQGYTLEFDQAGAVILRDVSGIEWSTPVYQYARGAAAVIVDSARSADLTRLYNGVVASGEGSDVAAAVHGEAWDDDPNSPTYYLGPLGKVPYFYASPLLATDDQAEAAAASLLVKVKGRVETLAWSQVVNPALEPLDAVSVEQADGSLVTYILDEVTTPLACTDAQGATARETVVRY